MEKPLMRRPKASSAVTVILIFGVISLLGDMVYESARSANSQYLNILGVSATTVGLVFGLGEFLGYGLRLLAGVWSDRSQRHWLFMFLGYAMLIVVPMLGLTKALPALLALILLERVGKALRNPAKDTVLSSVAQNQVGVGFAFGLQEALDQVGAFLGPMIFTAIFFFTGRVTVAEYQLGYRLLLAPFLGLMAFLWFAWRRIEDEKLAPELKIREYRSERLPRLFWIYTLFTLTCTLGFVNFATTGYHVKARGLLSDGDITLFYALAMAADAVIALLVGRLYDRLKRRTGKKTGGLLLLAVIPLITVFLPFLTLSMNRALIIAGILIFGVVMGTHETVMRSAIADITPFYKRGTSYGVFNAAYGLALMGGAFGMGWLYDRGLVSLIQGGAVALQALAIVFFLMMVRQIRIRV